MVLYPIKPPYHKSIIVLYTFNITNPYFRPMRFTVSTTALQKNLQVISGAIGNNRTMPISEDFIFNIKDGQLAITATDFETSMSVLMEVIADDDGHVAIPAKMLLETLKSLPDQPLTFKVNPDTYAIEILSQNGKYKLAGEDASDFLNLMTIGDADSFTINSVALARAIQYTLFAIGTDELRPAMTGVYFHTDADSLLFVSTDAQKLVRYRQEGNPAGEATSFIIPKKAMGLLKSALPSGDTEVRISYNRINAFFEVGGVQLVCRLLDARFPDYRAVIPQENPNKLTINKNDLAATLKRLSIFANKNNYQVVFELGAEGEVNLSTQDLDHSNEASERLDCRYEGEEMRIAFNARFLSEMLAVLETDEINLEMSMPNRAGIITPLEQQQGSNILMLIMPLMLFN